MAAIKKAYYSEAVIGNKTPLLFVKKVTYLKLMKVLQGMESLETNTFDGGHICTLMYMQFSLAMSTTHHLVSHSGV